MSEEVFPFLRASKMIRFTRVHLREIKAGLVFFPGDNLRLVFYVKRNDNKILEFFSVWHDTAVNKIPCKVHDFPEELFLIEAATLGIFEVHWVHRDLPV